MITQIDPPLHMQTTKGPGWAHFILDYGPEHHVIWGVAMDADGAWWWVPNPEAKLSPNWTMERRPQPA
jgi:hypothetical protein